MPLFWLLAIFFLKDTQCLPWSGASVGFVNAAVEYFQPLNVFFVFSSQTQLEQRQQMLQMEKAVSSRQGVPSLAIDFSTLFCFLSRPSFHIDRPLFIILTNDHKTRNALQALTLIFSSSKVTWLLFYDQQQQQQLDDFLSEVNLPFDGTFFVARAMTEGTVSVSEVYRVSPSYPLRESHVGTWSLSKGRSGWPKHEKYDRRSNLEGFEFHTAIINSPPFTALDHRKSQIALVGGYFYEVWKILEQELNFTTSYDMPADGACGMVSNGMWNGVIGMVARGEVHLGFADLQMTSYRKEVVDFTIPLLFTRTQLYMRRPQNSSLHWSSFLKPFSPRLWCAVSVSFLILAALVAAMKQQSHNHTNFIFSDSVLSIFGLFCGQGCSILPESMSSRILIMCAGVIGVVLTAAYAATLVSILAVQTLTLPFHSLSDMLAHGSYTLNVLANSAIFNMFDHAKEDTLLGNLYTRLLNHHDALPKTTKEGLDQLCSQDGIAFMAEHDVVMAFIPQLPCQIVAVPRESSTASIAIALEKNSSYREVLNYVLYRLNNGGILNRLRGHAWTSTSLLQSDMKFNQVQLVEVIPLLVFLTTVAVISFLFLLIECLIHKHKTSLYIHSRRKRDFHFSFKIPV